MKINRYEVGPQLGFVTNDPFLNRYLGGVRGAYHVTEVLGVEGSFIFSPELDGADEKAITKQLEAFNQVTPDISKIQYTADMTLQFSPIYGKVAMFGRNIINFDIFGSFGTGIVRTATTRVGRGQRPARCRYTGTDSPFPHLRWRCSGHLL